MHFLRLSGDEACKIDAETSEVSYPILINPQERLSDIRTRLLGALKADITDFDVIFPDGRLLSAISRQDQSAVLSSVFERAA